jgi:hypothetical protein
MTQTTSSAAALTQRDANIVSDRDGDQTGRWLRVRKELPSEMPLA